MKNYDQNEQRKIWDSIARGWTGWRHETRDDIKEFTKEWRKGKILDVGCGNGRNLLHFAKLGFDAYGVDFSSEMIKQAENLFKKNEISIKKNHLIVADMTSLPFEDGSLITAYPLHHSIIYRKKNKLME
jgi:ubiquinone/menaquinone biosynthesis C-methylase UbiE